MSLSDLCREFGVSRPTGYRWINRYKEVDPEGLLDLSRKPHGCAHATPETVENAILALRNKHPSWGARKLKARLEVLQPRVNWPAASTFGNLLSRAGMTNPKQKKRRTTPYSEPFSAVTAPNQLWCMDFKGYFSTGDDARCDPFTITDVHSRCLIRCQSVLRMDLSQVSAICEAAMHEYGIPTRIRTDNGAPFAGNGLLGLSKLSISWTKLGIVHELVLARWGLAPFFTKELSDIKGLSTINARAESIMKAPTWREPMKKRRCIVPANAFFEWSKVSPPLKQPYAFELANGNPIAFAGLWDAWKDKQGHWLQSFAIVTTEANELMSRVHPRMPVILHPRDYDRWLDREETERLPLDLLRPLESEEMEMFEADPKVGNVRNNGPELMRKAAAAAEDGELPL